jgi:hypothetical protein
MKKIFSAKTMKVLAFFIMFMNFYATGSAQVAGMPYIVPLPPVTLVCNSFLMYNNHYVMHPDKDNPGVAPGIGVGDQEIYVKVKTVIDLSGVTMKARLATGDNGFTPVYPGSIYFETAAPFFLPKGENWVKLKIQNGIVPKRGIYPIIWTVMENENIVYENGNFLQCDSIGIESNYGDLSIIFCDNNGATRQNWGPGEDSSDGPDLKHCARSAAILGPKRSMEGNFAAGGENFDNTPTATVNCNFKLYGTDGAFKFTVSVGVAGDNSGRDTHVVFDAVQGKTTHGYAEIPDIIIHARENIGDPEDVGHIIGGDGHENGLHARLILQAYHEHVKQGGWLIYAAREAGSYYGEKATKRLLDSLGVVYSSIGIDHHDEAHSHTISATAGVQGTVSDYAYELVSGYAPFGDVNDQEFVFQKDNADCPTVFGLDPTESTVFMTAEDGGAMAFVCKKPGWLGGFIYLAVGTRCDVSGNYPAMYSKPSWADNTWSSYPAGYGNWPNSVQSTDGFVPLSANAKLEMNALAFIVQRNRADDINMPEKPTVANP